MQVSFVTKIPKFERFGLITSESLNLISFNLFNFINAKYVDSSEGVITGFDVTYDKNKKNFCVGKGILKIEETVFFSNESIFLDIPEKEGRYCCVIEFYSKKDENYFENILTVNLIDQKEYKGEFILFEIILREGADIEQDNNHFEEFRDEFNAISLINQKYSASNSEFSTLSPIILKKWAYTASQKLRLENIDLNFIFLCLNSIVKKELLIAYLENKLGISININEITNSEIIKKLASILKGNMKKEKKEKEDYEESFYLE